MRKEDNKEEDDFYVLSCDGHILLDRNMEKKLALKGSILSNCYTELDYSTFNGTKIGYFKRPVALIYFKDKKMVKQFVNNVEFKLATGVAML